MSSLWIRSPNLWSQAMDRAARDEPRWTTAFWRKVKLSYLKFGGKLINDEDLNDREEENY